MFCRQVTNFFEGGAENAMDKDKGDSSKSKQIRIGHDYAREMEMEAVTQDRSIKSLIEEVWDRRKQTEFAFFPDVFKVESDSANRDETILCLRQVASVFNRPLEDRDRRWLVGALDLMRDRQKLLNQKDS